DVPPRNGIEARGRPQGDTRTFPMAGARLVTLSQVPQRATRLPTPFACLSPVCRMDGSGPAELHGLRRGGTRGPSFCRALFLEVEHDSSEPVAPARISTSPAPRACCVFFRGRSLNHAHPGTTCDPAPAIAKLRPLRGIPGRCSQPH